MNLFKSLSIVSLAALIFGCGSQSNTNTANVNQKTPAANTNQTAATPAPAQEAPPTGSLATPSDAYRTAYALREKKDVAGLKKLLSKDVIEFLTMIAEEEKKTLDDEIAQMFVKPQAKTAETRKETIRGDRASLEYLDEKGEWKTMDFVREGNDWKLGMPSKDSPEPGAPEKK